MAWWNNCRANNCRSSWQNDGTDELYLYPYHAIPVDGNSESGPAFGVWYSRMGPQGIEPPDNVKKVLDMFARRSQIPPEERIKIGQDIWKIITDEVWTMGTVGQFPAPSWVCVWSRTTWATSRPASSTSRPDRRPISRARLLLLQGRRALIRRSGSYPGQKKSGFWQGNPTSRRPSELCDERSAFQTLFIDELQMVNLPYPACRRRLVTIWAASVISFVVIQLPPGDYVTAYIAALQSTVVSQRRSGNACASSTAWTSPSMYSMRNGWGSCCAAISVWPWNTTGPSAR